MRLPDTLTEIGGWAFGDCNMKRIYMPKSVTKIGEHAFAIERPAEPIRAGEYTEFMWYGDEEQDAECEADVAPIDNCPVGFLLGVDNEECAAAQYAKENNIPYEVITDVDTFLNIR
jgi:hypothetical protein